VHLGGYLGPLAETLGVLVEEFAPLDPQSADASHVQIAFADGHQGTGTVWSEQVHLRGASEVARFAAGDLAGRPAVTRHERGEGVAWYLATRPDEATTRRLIDAVLAEADIAPVLPGAPEGVQAAVREGGGERLLILLNHNTEPQAVTLPAPMRIEIGPARGTVTDAVLMAPFDVAVLRWIEG
jgi:beta-galactosidase